MMITMESIEKKLGFDPLDARNYPVFKAEVITEDDSQPNPLDILSDEELDFLGEKMKNNPECKTFGELSEERKKNR